MPYVFVHIINHTQVQHRYRLHSLATMLLLAAVHIVCFALTVSSVFTKRDSMLQLGRSGQAQRYMHQVCRPSRSYLCTVYWGERGW